MHRPSTKPPLTAADHDAADYRIGPKKPPGVIFCGVLLVFLRWGGFLRWSDIYRTPVIKGMFYLSFASFITGGVSRGGGGDIDGG